jgi:hypothetical protein
VNNALQLEIRGGPNFSDQELVFSYFLPSYSPSFLSYFPLLLTLFYRSAWDEAVGLQSIQNLGLGAIDSHPYGRQS